MSIRRSLASALLSGNSHPKPFKLGVDADAKGGCLHDAVAIGIQASDLDALAEADATADSAAAKAVDDRAVAGSSLSVEKAAAAVDAA
jgi:hypothetical protein